MASQLSVTFATGADRTLALRKLQTIADGSVAPRITIIAREHTNHADLDFPDDVPAEQVLACFERAVNMAGVTDSGYVSGSPLLTGDVGSGSRQLGYSV